MSITSTTSRVSYTGNGAVDTYSYTFRIFHQDDLLVTVRNTSDVETTLTITTDYTVTGVGDAGGGSIVLVNSSQAWLDADGDLKSNYILTIRRVRDLTQETDIRNQGTFYPETHEDAFDHGIMVAQQQQDEINRSIKLPETLTASDFDPELPATITDAADKVPLINATGNGWAAIDDWPIGSSLTSSTAISTAVATHAALTATHGVSGAIVGTTDTQTLTNKSLSDSTTYIIDNSDSTKKMQFQVSGVTTSTTRTLTVPDADTTIAGTDATQTLTNKSLSDSTTYIIDNADNTKKLQFQASGITTGTTRTLTAPDFDGTIATLAGTETLTNKTLTSPTINTPTITVLDNAFTIQDNADNTKQLQIQASGITTGTTRTLTVPNASGTLVLNDNTATLSGKTFSDSTEFTTAIKTPLLKNTSDSTAINLSTRWLYDAAGNAIGDFNDTYLAVFRGVAYWAQDTSGVIILRAPLTAVSGYAIYLPASQGDAGKTMVNDGSGNLTWGTVAIAGGGTNNSSLGVTAGGVIYTDGTKLMNVGAGSSGQILRSNGSSAPSWAAAPSGGINYISANPDAESDAASWTTYDDAAATPVDLTGGSFGGTFARTTTTALRGSGSFLYTPGTAGEGVAITITPDLADYGNVLEFGFDYDFVTANGATGDYTVWVYDVANSVLIQPVGYQVPGATTGIYGKFKCTFQVPINATTLRIGIHQAATTSAALEFDNVYCGPQIKSYGPQVSDYIAFTPTGSWSSNTTYTGFWRRVGDSLECDVKLALSGAPTSATLTVNLPSGMSIDTAKIANAVDGNASFGFGTVLDSGTANYDLKVTYNSATSVGVRVKNASSTYAADNVVNATTPVTFANGDTIQIKFSVPISGWSSGQLLSSDAETRVVAARYSTAAAQSISGSTVTIVDFGTKDFDTHSLVTTGASWKFTAATPGVYDVSAVVSWASTAWSSGAYYRMQLYKNGSAHTVLFKNNVPGITAVLGMSGSGLVNLNAGDYIDIRVDQNQGTVALYNDGAYCNVSIKRLSGPSQIAANELVSVRATHTTGQTIEGAGVYETVIWDTETWDTHGMHSTSTGVVTVPVAGKYLVKANLRLETGGGWAAGEYVAIGIRKNGSFQSYDGGGYQTATHSTYISSRITDVVNCVAGDTIDIQIGQNSGGNINLTAAGTVCYMTIERIGF